MFIFAQTILGTWFFFFVKWAQACALGSRIFLQHFYSIQAAITARETRLPIDYFEDRVCEQYRACYWATFFSSSFIERVCVCVCMHVRLCLYMNGAILLDEFFFFVWNRCRSRHHHTATVVCTIWQSVALWPMLLSFFSFCLVSIIIIAFFFGMCSELLTNCQWHNIGARVRTAHQFDHSCVKCWLKDSTSSLLLIYNVLLDFYFILKRSFFSASFSNGIDIFVFFRWFFQL